MLSLLVSLIRDLQGGAVIRQIVYLRLGAQPGGRKQANFHRKVETPRVVHQAKNGAARRSLLPTKWELLPPFAQRLRRSLENCGNVATTSTLLSLDLMPFLSRLDEDAMK